ncbi:MAG: hypothetical protein P8189_14225 [Anaerolineae bacterium]|jgi:hypothetical protein
MKAKAMVLFGLRILVLALILFGLYAVDVLGLSLSEGVRTAPAMLLLVSLLQAAVLSYPIVRARWSGWRLVSAIFLLLYGVTTLMVAIEAVYLPEVLPADLVRHLLINGAITAAIFSPMAVLIHGRMGSTGEPEQTNLRLMMPWYQWLWRCALIAFSWAVIFAVFGALIYLPLAEALDPAALQASASPDLPAWVLPFQMIRALLWIALTLPVIRMMKGSWWETGLIVALLFSVLMGSNLLMPTDMSTGLQFAHLIEVSGEAFVFGWIVVGLLHQRHKSRHAKMIPSVSS